MWKIRFVIILAAMCSGCSGILLQHAMDRDSNLTPEQIRAYNETGNDVYSCLIAGGPPPSGTLVTILMPKGKPGIKFIDNCHVVAQ